MNLAYEAIDGTGRSIRDLVQADSPKAAVEQLRQRGLMVTHIEAASDHDVERSAKQVDATDAKLPLTQLVVFTRQMAMLLASGSTIVSALGAVARQLKSPLHAELVKRIKVDIEEGATLSEALRRWPDTFNPTYCAVIAAGESSATLPAMFDRLSRIVRGRRSIRNKVIGAMTYPALLTLLCIGTVSVTLFFVLPRFGEMFKSVGVPLPSLTKALLTLSQILVTYWPLFAGSAALAVGSLVFIVLHPAGRQWWANTQTQVPILGRVMRGLIQGSMFRTLGMLLEAKVSVLESLDLCRGTTANRRFQSMVTAMENAVAAGQVLSDALEASRLVEPAVCQAIRTGEESGNLGGAFTYAADVMDEDNVETVTSVTRLLEPMILIGMGIVVGAVAISLFLPMFDITSMVN